MDKIRQLLIATLTIVAVMLVVGCSNSPKDAPLIFVAASLVDVMDEIADKYSQETGQTVRFSFGGSNLLANQIVTGAPANAAIVAGTSPIRILLEGGKATSEDVVQVFGNRLVVVKPKKDDESRTSDLHALVGAGKIAMPDPASAPAGEYFEVALKELGIWESLQAQIVPTLDVRAALAAAASGNVEYAFVYETDATSTNDVEVAFTIEGASESAIPRYYASPMLGDDRADRFIEFMMTDLAMAILKKHGFHP